VCVRDDRARAVVAVARSFPSLSLFLCQHVYFQVQKTKVVSNAAMRRRQLL
jgi:hypothetical protein